MKIRNSAQDVILETSTQRDNRFTLETATGVYQITVGVDSGDLYITACTKQSLVLFPCGDYNCIRVSQRNE